VFLITAGLIPVAAFDHLNTEPCAASCARAKLPDIISIETI